jgi:hypothetical protein
MNDDQNRLITGGPSLPRSALVSTHGKMLLLFLVLTTERTFLAAGEPLRIEALLLVKGPSAGVGEDNIMKEHSVIALFFSFDLDPFSHLSFAACGISDFPQLA